MSERRQLLAEALRHGAEVLADDRALRALALQRDEAEQVVDRIGEIGALGGFRARRNDEQARQAHRVVDAQHAGGTHVGGDQRGEAAPAVARRSDRVGRRQVPGLALGRERVGRRADGDVARQLAGARPVLGAVRRRADREVAIEADLEPAGFRPLGRGGELAVGEPLAEQGEGDRLGFLARRSRQRVAFAVAQRRRPAAPVLAAAPRRDRFEDREAAQRLAAGGDEAVVVGEDGIVGPGGARAREGGVARGERLRA